LLNPKTLKARKPGHSMQDKSDKLKINTEPLDDALSPAVSPAREEKQFEYDQQDII